MRFSRKELDETEEKIKKYFRSQHEIGRLQNKLAVLQKRRGKIQRDIDRSNIMLEAKVSGIDYGSDRIQVSTISSQQERAVDNAFTDLEWSLQWIDSEISGMENQILEIEYENTDMDYIMRNLGERHKEFVYGKYRDRKRLVQMANDLHLSRSSVYDLRDEILEAVTAYITYK